MQEKEKVLKKKHICLNEMEEMDENSKTLKC